MCMFTITDKYPLTPDSGRVSFFCRMMEKALTRNDPGRYEIIHVVGQLKPIPASANTVPASPSTSVVSLGTRSSSGESIYHCCRKKNIVKYIIIEHFRKNYCTYFNSVITSERKHCW